MQLNIRPLFIRLNHLSKRLNAHNVYEIRFGAKNSISALLIWILMRSMKLKLLEVVHMPFKKVPLGFFYFLYLLHPLHYIKVMKLYCKAENTKLSSLTFELQAQPIFSVC